MYSTIKIKTCKCGCGKNQSKDCKGYNYGCLPKDLKKQIGTKRQIQVRNMAKRSNLKRKLHLAQKEVGLPKTALKRQKQVSKVSEKRLAELKTYNPLRKQFLKDHPICECGLPDCDKGESIDVHHTFMGSDRGKYFLEVATWKAVSRKDHYRIHNEISSEKLIELGLRKK